ncbi:hypothetical protein [Bartonella vinsonii]|uniref:Uncharacterized protein n=1 Tax=Bartonella vinsonii TaxID=33047 RepID=A0A3S4Z4P0_BARVI|nr:hypothetical protein [Bartonella vinsonii]VEJ45645.1 Uncharacterised protein [Bartonella vinsonii]
MCALRGFKNIKKNDLSDFIEHESLFKHEGDCEVEYNVSARRFIEDGCVFANAMFYNGACVCNDNTLYDSAQMNCMLPVASFVCVYGNAQLYGSLEVRSRLYVYNKMKIYCYSKVNSNAHVNGGNHFYSNVQVYNDEILKNVRIHVDALV